MDLGLHGARCVVTGGSKGMGRAVAERLAAEGAKVCVMARGAAAVEETVDRLQDIGSAGSFGLTCDFGDADAVTDAFARVSERWADIQVLVHTVGPAGGTFESLDDTAWLEALEIGTLSTVRAVRGALPLLRASPWARICTFAASSIRRPNGRTIAYTAAKSATASISKTLAKELGREQILVNCVCPGTVVSASFTERLAPWISAEGLDPADPTDVMDWVTDKFGDGNAVGRAGLPQEIASLTAYLVSRTNTYVTGAVVNVDGGTDF